jgi:hypothetical protein
VKLWPIIAASTAGAIVGFLGTVYVGMAMNLGTSLTSTATVLLVIVCPPIYLIWWGWWLVPILNAALYGGVALGIAKWRSSRQKIQTSR